MVFYSEVAISHYHRALGSFVGHDLAQLDEIVVGPVPTYQDELVL